MVTTSTDRTYDFDVPAIYQISVQGAVSPAWADRFEGMTINETSLADDLPMTILVGVLSDQSSLAGVLNLLYEMQVVVLSVTRIGDAPA